MHWKWWTLLATLAWTAWGVGVKFVLKRIDWMRLEVLTGFAILLLMALIAPTGYRLKADMDHLVGIVAGSFGVFGGILFYIALSKGPVSVIIPLTSLYVVGVFIVGVVLLGEAWSWRKALGVACAVLAMLLLAGEEG